MFFKVLLLAFFVAATIADQDSLESRWTQYKLDHHRNYDAAEDAKRFAIFTEAVAKIDAHNKDYHSGKSTFEMGLNEFTDMTTEELARHRGIKVHH